MNTSDLRIQKALFPFKSFYRIPYLLVPWLEKEVNIFWYHFFDRNKASVDLQETIKKKLNPGQKIFLLDSGRHALKMLLDSADFGRGAEIIVPVLCCNVIPKTIFDSGYTPVFADIGEDLCLTVDSIKKVVSKNTKSVMLVHAGGAAAAEYKNIVEYCNTNGLFLIDNAAQAWGNELDGLWLGAKGNAGITSFGLGKSTFGVGGGALFTNSETIEKVDDQDKYSKARLLGFYLQYVKRSHTEPFFMFLNKICSRADGGRIRSISGLDLNLQLALLEDMDKIISRRTEISLEIISRLSAGGVNFPQENNKHVWTKLIITLPGKLKACLAKYLYMNRIESEAYYQPHYVNRYWIENSRFSDKGYAMAEKLTGRLLVLPNSPRLSSTQLEYLYKKLEQFKAQYL